MLNDRIRYPGTKNKRLILLRISIILIYTSQDTHYFPKKEYNRHFCI